MLWIPEIGNSMHCSESNPKLIFAWMKLISSLYVVFPFSLELF